MKFYLLDHMCEEDIGVVGSHLFVRNFSMKEKINKELKYHLQRVDITDDEVDEILNHGKTLWRKNNYRLRYIESKI